MVDRCGLRSIVLFLGELVTELGGETAVDIGRFVLASRVGVSVGLGSAEIVGFLDVNRFVCGDRDNGQRDPSLVVFVSVCGGWIINKFTLRIFS